jgi:signal transduction histidine kinase
MREFAGSAAVADGFTGDGTGAGRPVAPPLRLVEEGADLLRQAGRPIDEAEQVRLTRELHEARTVETVGRFAVSIAHDFNSLCSALVYFAEVATSCVQAGGDPSAVIGHIAETAQSAGELSRQILSFTRDQLTEPIRLALGSAVTELTPLLRCLAGPERDLDIGVGGDGASVRIAPSHLRQVLLNLLVNAHDATRPGGRITIATGTEDVDGARCVVLRVGDDGDGMDARTLAHCFEPFFTTKGMGKGTGIGLATVRDIVELYGGRVVAASTPGAGSIFTVHLPAA